ncbi:hypothetical protein [Bradyrhizobium lupini]|uniref:hypothetical protein n=1 Tax=Rhizobium lupini TaxID=136996 RepID=UPI0034C65DBC
MLQLPQSAVGQHRSKRQDAIADPVLAMIAEHQRLAMAWQALYDQLQEAEFEATKKHGPRPIGLIQWRGYTIGAGEIEARREQLLEAGEINRATIEREYLDAKARYDAQLAAGVTWDRRAKLLRLSKEVDRRVAAERRYAKRLANTAPTTPAAAAALIQYMLDEEFCTDKDWWHLTALQNLVASLDAMPAAARS